MISYPLLKRNMVSCLKPFLIIFAVLCMYTLVIVYLYDPKMADMLNQYQEALPGIMAAAGMTGIASSLLEWMQIYLYGFLMLLFPLIFIIILVNKLIMEYIDNGSMANLLATPNSRRKIICTQVLSLGLWLVILMVSLTVTGIAGGQVLFPDELDIKRYCLLNGSTLLMQLLVCGIAFLAACVSSEARKFYTLGAGLPILFFLLQAISNMGEKLEKLKYVTIYTLLPASEIVQGKSGIWLQNVIMAALALLLFGCGSWWFCRRDLSV